MSLRKIKGTTIYPKPTLRSRVETIASEEERTFTWYACRLMELGLEVVEAQRRQSQDGKQTQRA